MPVGTDQYSYMDEDELIYELSRILHRVTAAEDLIQRAEAFYEEQKTEWSRELPAYFFDTLERKKELIAYEWEIIRRLGEAIAAGRNYRHFDI